MNDLSFINLLDIYLIKEYICIEYHTLSALKLHNESDIIQKLEYNE